MPIVYSSCVTCSRLPSSCYFFVLSVSLLILHSIYFWKETKCIPSSHIVSVSSLCSSSLCRHKKEVQKKDTFTLQIPSSFCVVLSLHGNERTWKCSHSCFPTTHTVFQTKKKIVNDWKNVSSRRVCTHTDQLKGVLKRVFSRREKIVSLKHTFSLLVLVSSFSFACSLNHILVCLFLFPRGNRSMIVNRLKAPDEDTNSLFSQSNSMNKTWGTVSR